MRDKALIKWREAACQMNGSAEHLIATIEQSFPASGEIGRRFAFEIQMFQIAAPEHLRLEIADGIAELEVASERRRITEVGIRRETIEEFGLGFCSKGMMGGRAAFPLFDPHGQLVGYAGCWAGNELPDQQPLWR